MKLLLKLFIELDIIFVNIFGKGETLIGLKKDVMDFGNRSENGEENGDENIGKVLKIKGKYRKIMIELCMKL